MAKAEKNVTRLEHKHHPAHRGSRHMLNPFEEMERMFEGMSSRGWMRPSDWFSPAWAETGTRLETKIPKVDVIDRDDEIFVKAEIPGVKKKDLEVTVSDNAVTIKGSTKEEEKEERGDYYRCEIQEGSFSRTVLLPSDVDGDKAKASFNDGILELTLPKVARAKKRSIKLD